MMTSEVVHKDDGPVQTFNVIKLTIEVLMISIIIRMQIFNNAQSINNSIFDY